MASKNQQKEVKVLKVTTMDELRAYRDGSLVELPPFAQDQPFVARLKRPSMLGLVEQGKIPNELLGLAQKLFMGEKVKEEDNQAFLKNLSEVIEVLAKESFVDPTYEQLKAEGVELTDDQKIFMFNYAQNGIKELGNFRKKQKNS